MKDYYRILQITPDASQEEIKKAYRRLAKVHHPDVAGGGREEVVIHEINEAYRTLGNPEKRSRYDWIRTNREAGALETEAANQRAERARSYRRRSAEEPLGERELVRPYLKYTYLICKIGLLFCFLLLADFILPLQQRVDKVTYVKEVYSGSEGRRAYDYTQLKTWKGHSTAVSKELGIYFSENPNIRLFRTPIFSKTRYVSAAPRNSERFLIGQSVYANFVFLPLLLLMCSFFGSIRQFSPEVDFSFGVAVGVLILVCGGLLLV